MRAINALTLYFFALIYNGLKFSLCFFLDNLSLTLTTKIKKKERSNFQLGVKCEFLESIKLLFSQVSSSQQEINEKNNS